MDISQFKRDDCWDFNGFKLPLLEKAEEDILFNHVFDETILCHVSSKNNKSIYEYCGREVVKVQRGDVVIDAGAWIGDFSAY